MSKEMDLPKETSAYSEEFSSQEFAQTIEKKNKFELTFESSGI